MADIRFAICLLVLSIIARPNIAIADDGSSVALPARIPFTLTCHPAAGDERQVSGTLNLSERGATWQPAGSVLTSMANIWRLRGDWSHSEPQLRLDLSYECQGSEDPKRRFCFETRALDKDGKLLAHDWQVEGDNRIRPAEVDAGSLRMVRSRLNSTNNRLESHALLHLAGLELRLTEMPAGLPSHFPAAPHKLNLAVTQPDKCGRIDVTFTNRLGWDLEPAKHQIAFQVFVHDSNGKRIRADRRFLLYRKDGHYREHVCVERQYYDYSRVSIAIFTRQPDNEKFIRGFFFGGGSEYHGMWTGDGGLLIELPLIDGPLFNDLPERSTLADE